MRDFSIREWKMKNENPSKRWMVKRMLRLVRQNIHVRWFFSLVQERPYHDDSTASRLLSEVKHRRAQLVLRWGTTLESRVLFFCSFGNDKFDCCTRGERGLELSLMSANSVVLLLTTTMYDSREGLELLLMSAYISRTFIHSCRRRSWKSSCSCMTEEYWSLSRHRRWHT